MKLALSIDISGNPLDAMRKMRDHVVEESKNLHLKAQLLKANIDEAIEGRRAKNEYMKWAEQMWEEGHVEVKPIDSPMIPEREEVYG